MTSSAWVDLEGVDLAPTLSTLHLWTQVVGKAKLMTTPWGSHVWHVPRYLSARACVTGLVSTAGMDFTAEFDLISAGLVVRTTADAKARRPLAPGSVADCGEAVLDVLQAAGADVTINPMPNERATWSSPGFQHERRPSPRRRTSVERCRDARSLFA